MTNVDKIRAMTDEELAEYLCLLHPNCPPGYGTCFTPNCAKLYGCYDCWLNWLKQEVQ